MDVDEGTKAIPRDVLDAIESGQPEQASLEDQMSYYRAKHQVLQEKLKFKELEAAITRLEREMNAPVQPPIVQSELVSPLGKPPTQSGLMVLEPKANVPSPSDSRALVPVADPDLRVQVAQIHAEPDEQKREESVTQLQQRKRRRVDPKQDPMSSIQNKVASGQQFSIEDAKYIQKLLTRQQQIPGEVAKAFRTWYLDWLQSVWATADLATLRKHGTINGIQIQQSDIAKILRGRQQVTQPQRGSSQDLFASGLPAGALGGLSKKLHLSHTSQDQIQQNIKKVKPKSLNRAHKLYRKAIKRYPDHPGLNKIHKSLENEIKLRRSTLLDTKKHFQSKILKI
jgi:hypothetical protein